MTETRYRQRPSDISLDWVHGFGLAEPLLCWGVTTRGMPLICGPLLQVTSRRLATSQQLAAGREEFKGHLSILKRTLISWLPGEPERIVQHKLKTGQIVSINSDASEMVAVHRGYTQEMGNDRKANEEHNDHVLTSKPRSMCNPYPSDDGPCSSSLHVCNLLSHEEYLVWRDMIGLDWKLRPPDSIPGPLLLGKCHGSGLTLRCG